MDIESRDFSYYETTTVDPGWTLTIVVIIICLLLNSSLPFLVRFGKAWDKRRATECTSSKGTCEGGSPSEESHARNAGTRNESFSPEITSSPRKIPLGSPYNVPSGAASVVSEAHSSSAISVASSTYISQIASVVLNARPRKKRNHHYHHHYHHYQHQHGVERRTREPDEDSRKLSIKAQPTQAYEMDDSSVCKSVMSMLDLDAVSVQDAIDAQEGSPYQKPSMQKLKGWQQIIEIADWDSEMQRLGTLSIPYVIAGATEGFFQIINVAIIGHLLGVKEANAYMSVTILLEFTSVFTYGFTEGMCCTSI
jgi:hypothetical protein